MVESDVDEATIILQTSRRRSSVSSVLRSHNEDEWGTQSNYSSGVDSSDNRRKCNRKIVHYNNENLIETKPKKTLKYLPESSSIPFSNNQFDDNEISEDSCTHDIHRRVKTRDKSTEDFLLSVKKRISYKEAIENGSHSDYSYDSENKTCLKDKSDLTKRKTKNRTNGKIRLRQKNRNHINKSDSTDESSDEKGIRVKKDKAIYTDNGNDSMPESNSNYKNKRDIPSKCKPQSSELIDIQSETEEMSPQNEVNKKHKKHKIDSSEKSDKRKSYDKAIRGTNIENLLKHTDQSLPEVDNEKSSNDEKHQKKVRLMLPPPSKTIKHSLSTPLF